MHFTKEKIKRHLREVKETIHRHTIQISAFKYYKGECEGAEDPSFDDSNWENFHLGDFWGGYDKTAWFRTTVAVPEEWKDKKVYLRFLVGPRDGGNSTAEAMLYVGGKPLQGIDVWHEEAWVPQENLENGELDIAIKAWSGVLEVPDRRRFKEAQLIWIDEYAEKYYFMAETLLHAVNEVDKEDLRYTRLLEVLNHSVNMIDFLKIKSDEYYQSLRNAWEYLQEKIAEFAELEEMKPTVVALGHAHIDMAWLWRLCHTKEKAARTFTTVLHLMRQYPEYRYIHTSPQLYKYMKEEYPDIYEQIKERVKTGEWEITGGMWVEPDTNVPSGESLIRQILFGKRFIKEEFGIDSQVVWLPDVFGYSWSLPQIMKKSGIKQFMTTKISWNQYNRFPFDTFNWRGMDGTEIPTHFITTPEDGSKFYTYNGMISPESIKGIWDAYKQKDINDELLISYGWGDGGGGPTKEMIETGRVLQNLPGIPRVKTGKAEEYFERLQNRLKGKDVPMWDGELYLEYHRGTYTSQAAIKRGNRKSEVMYHDTEWLNTLKVLLTDDTYYPHQELAEGWELLLLNQFHDILPGSSIRQVNEDARADYRTIQTIGQEQLDKAKGRLISQIQAEEDRVLVYNSLGFERDDYIEVPFSSKINEDVTLESETGESVPSQVIEEEGERKLLVKAEKVPSLGYKSYRLVKKQENSPSLTIKTDYLENPYYCIHLNDKGQIASIFDKKNQREIIADGERGNVFQVFQDKPMEFDAWDIDIFYQEKMREIDRLVSAEIIESGPIRGTLKLSWKFSDSIISQYISIYLDSPRIDFKTEIDWKEKQVLLKVAFPVNVRSTRATYDIQFGNIERPTHWNTSWDYAKFEVVGHKWVDLSEGNYGVSLLNDCKYGHDIKNNVIRLTLIKSSIRPDETADRCMHHFTYSLLPHAGDWRESSVMEEGYKVNYPLIVEELAENKAGTIPAEFSFAKTDADNIVIETVKQSEDGEAAIIRLYEAKQYRQHDIKIMFHQQIKRAVECNLIEEEEKELISEGNILSFDIKPYEIKTFKVWFS